MTAPEQCRETEGGVQVLPKRRGLGNTLGFQLRPQEARVTEIKATPQSNSLKVMTIPEEGGENGNRSAVTNPMAQPGWAQGDLLVLYLLEVKGTVTLLGERQHYPEPLQILTHNVRHPVKNYKGC